MHRLVKELLKLQANAVNILLTQADHCSIVDNDIGQESVRFVVIIDRCSIIDFLSAMVDFHRRQQVHPADNDWRADDADDRGLPVEEDAAAQTHNHDEDYLKESDEHLRGHTVEQSNIARDRLGDDSRRAVLPIEPANLLVQDLFDELNSDQKSHLLAHHLEDAIFTAFHNNLQEYPACQEDEPLDSLFFPLSVAFSLGKESELQLDFEESNDWLGESVERCREAHDEDHDLRLVVLEDSLPSSIC